MNARIFGVMLRAQARYVAPFLALAILVGVALPLATLQGLNVADALELDRVGLVLEQSRIVAGAYPILALCLGAFLSVATWLPDVHWRWVYVLTLPVDRTRLAIMRSAAGMLLVLPVSAAIWLSGMLAAKVADLPDLVRAYPGVLSLRFIAGAAAAYSIGSLCVIAGKRLWLVPIAVGGLLLLQALGIGLIFNVIDLIFLHPFSPLHALSGQWVLFDV